jgi:polar amino acid transport system substrate-binding protein
MAWIWQRSVGALLLAAMSAAGALGQGMPYHADPDAREMLPSLSPVPAIRFLTTADFPPFNFRDAQGELIGFNIQAWPWDQVANALTDSQGDALIAGLAMSPENGELFDFSAVYLALPGRFVTRAEDIEGFAVAELAGRSVAVRTGSSHDQFMARYLPEVERTGFDSETEALEAVRDGRLDAYFGDAMRASFWLNENLACCGFAGEPYFRPQLFGDGLTIAVPAGNDPVRHSIDWALRRLQENGALDELYLRWFPVGFY